MENSLKIKHVRGRMILDSRGNPTVEAILTTAHYTVSASVPSGASTGTHEAKELRDGGKAWNGNGVRKAITNIDAINKRIAGMLVVDQERVDESMIALDGTRDKHALGANAILAVSIATAKAAALHARRPLYAWIATLAKTEPCIPIPYANILNGGRHTSTKLAFQEFMIVPHAKSFSEGTEIITRTYHALHDILAKRYGSTGIGDEGGFAPPIDTPEEALTLLNEAAKLAATSKKLSYAIDVAANEFYDGTRGLYRPLPVGQGKTLNQMIAYYEHLLDGYPIISIEDPFHEEDFMGYSLLRSKVGKVMIVADDLTTTNPERIKHAIRKKSANTLLLKMNQIGTLTEALEAARLAREAGWKIMVSHRSAETEDHFLADLAVGLGCGHIKLGACARGERTAKYNQLLRIEDNHPRLAYGALASSARTRSGSVR